MNNPLQSIDNDEFSSFLNEAGWGSVDILPLSVDMGLRRYFLLQDKGKTALLMDMSRAGLESGLKDYVKIDKYLASLNIKVPDIYHYDLESGLAVIEDLGKESFGDAVRSGKDKKELYRLATDVLIQMRDQVKENELNLLNFKDSVPFYKLSFFIKDYVPASTKRLYQEQDMVEFNQIIAGIMENAAPCAQTFSHADYHLENLMWLDGEKPFYALIDFQDAFWGALPYDLLNLLEDARQTVPQDIKQEMKALYCQDMSVEERSGFDDWYCILSMFFHCKVIGQITKYYLERDMDSYIEHIPRLQNYIKENLKNPIMAPLKEWLEEKQVSFDISLDLLLKK